MWWPWCLAYDDIETEYHLTPDGWKTGDPPSNRIETWICHQYQASPYSRTLVQWRPKWADPKIPRAERDELRAKYEEFMGKPGRTGTGGLAKETTIGEPF